MCVVGNRFYEQKCHNVCACAVTNVDNLPMDTHISIIQYL